MKATRAPAEPIRAFAIQAAAFLFVFTVLAFIGIFWRITSLIDQRVAEQASSYADLIVDARAWNAMHGGVWVLKTPTSPTNPYLRALGVEPDTSTVSGATLTLRNPTAMTNEMSRIALANDQVTFRLTSLKPVNPADKPDAWERQQLERFTNNRAQVTHIETRGNARVLRLMRPLITEPDCLRCHAKQGYRVGDVRGALSVLVPLGPTDAAVKRSAWILVGIFILVAIITGLVGYGLLRRLTSTLEESEVMLRLAATTDALTGVSNRRAVFERLAEEVVRARRLKSSLGVIVMDIDHFKRVNDAFGHAAGDAVLREITTRLSAQLREYDMLGRIGGEEFLLVAPVTELDALMHLAERLRLAVCERPVVHEGASIRASVSAGITVGLAEDTIDTLVARADTALYEAKANGRNRVEVG
jgi:diguanylate cyclase (GGDEF)-like protein